MFALHLTKSSIDELVSHPCVRVGIGGFDLFSRSTCHLGGGRGGLFSLIATSPIIVVPSPSVNLVLACFQVLC